ncbi:MAG: DUF1932 domain-containing protein [Usitatibacter sp.]
MRIAQVGYGEVGGIFAAALAKAGAREVAAFDVLVSDATWASAARDRAARDGVTLAPRLADAVAQADLVICAVTAAATAEAAAQISRACRKGAFVLDVNSASPRTKSECAKVVEQAGGRYVEAAVLSSVPPYGLRVPMLLGGPHADALLPTLATLGFEASVGSPRYGVVSAIKLCRSIVVKGMEALAIESLLAARRYGVEDEVLASLVETYPGFDWERQATYFWRRVVQHGKRRAEEMREAAVTADDAGVPPRMATATAEVQAWMAALRADGVFTDAPAEKGWREMADCIEAGADAAKRRAG